MIVAVVVMVMGEVVRHEEAISAGYEILDAIARYELLTARRREADSPSAMKSRDQSFRGS